MRVAILATVVAVVVGFALPVSAGERPGDPFGNHTIEIKEGPLVAIWKSLQRKMHLEKAYFKSSMKFVSIGAKLYWDT
jgi:hypothetical protein